MNNIHLRNQIFFAYEAVKKKETLENELAQKRQAIFDFIENKQTPKRFLMFGIISFVINNALLLVFGMTLGKHIASEQQTIISFLIYCYNPFESLLLAIVCWGVFLYMFIKFSFEFWEFNPNNYYPKYKNTDEVKKLEKEISEINNKITTLVHSPEYVNDTKIFAQRYHSTAWIVTIFNLIKNGRADTIKEALNIAEQELKMQQLQQQNRQMQQAMNEAIYQAQIAAINSEDASAMARINFYDRF